MKEIEHLLKPRWKVIAGYPNGSLSIGDILYKHIFPETGNYCYVTNPDILLLGNSMRPGEVENYPHLFKSLAWWEERSIEEMPEYIKDSGGEVIKVVEWSHNGIGQMWFIEDSGHGTYAEDFEPATEDQYLTFQKQQP